MSRSSELSFWWSQTSEPKMLDTFHWIALVGRYYSLVTTKEINFDVLLSSFNLYNLLLISQDNCWIGQPHQPWRPRVFISFKIWIHLLFNFPSYHIHQPGQQQIHEENGNPNYRYLVKRSHWLTRFHFSVLLIQLTFRLINDFTSSLNVFFIIVTTLYILTRQLSFKITSMVSPEINNDW